MLIIAIIIMIVIFVLVLKDTRKKPLIEGYDLKFDNKSFEDCAEFCKTTANCYAFGYNSKTGSCYPSQSVIVGQPLDTTYKNEYSKDNAVCNKFEPIIVPLQRAPFDERRKNSVFVCTDSGEMFPQTFIHNDDKFFNIGEGRNIDEIYQIDDYSVREIEWPKRYINNNELTTLHDGLKETKYKVDEVADIERILNFQPTIIPENGIESDSIFSKIGHDICKMFSRLRDSLWNPYDKREMQKYDADLISYETHDEINKGEYLNWFKCLKNVERRHCLEYCNNNPECVGVEFNPLFGGNKNVCCPYRTVELLHDRKPVHGMGRFYLKANHGKLSDEYQTNVQHK